jgi:hypothetical protein
MTKADISEKNDMTPKGIIFRQKAEKVIKNLKKHQIEGIYCENSRLAVSEICGLIPERSLVALGGSETILESGLVNALRKLNITLLDRYKTGVTKTEVDEMRFKGLSADVYIASSNAVTADGKLVNMDGIGNRVAGMIFGPKKVILMVGMNKVVNNVEEAITRIKTIAAPLDSIRVGIKTPCSQLGFCNDPYCVPPNRLCNQLVIIESNMFPNRITVVLVGEDLGY